AGAGYFIKCSAASIWSQIAEYFNNPTQVTLYAGWNALSVPYSTTNYTAESLLTEIKDQGGNCSEINKWGTSGWEVHSNIFPGPGFNITKGEGYFIKCSNSSTWTPT
ncbi:MAG: hypothetical protein U9M95_05415, partial [Candidatus Altiarchaeota archaeon]|nr:hypothetical protein [Candidatus Altiarchaeota archaeon]